jgi:hypothetical protein
MSNVDSSAESLVRQMLDKMHDDLVLDVIERIVGLMQGEAYLAIGAGSTRAAASAIAVASADKTLCEITGAVERLWAMVGVDNEGDS